ncbi:MAG: tRNA (adenosine(37)-N6)-threonylcarbamoyltransferase complex ATPase subunit type 1 TsaE [Desulfovibrionales bacterium]|nr:MAG: tRNA (adenosine(37)-N6)-threonylcarbamoyltransferase complex ATPase subunit type 1 TsaE [Desulfovibrionales bacterium]
MSRPSAPLHLFLPNQDATMKLGSSLVQVMRALDTYPALLLDGALGAGKTTFVRGLIQALPGGDLAEVASPSFNYVNVYPTRPETLHFDFYRLQGQPLDDDLTSALNETDYFVVAEWACALQPHDLPTPHLTIEFAMVSDGRAVTIKAEGDASTLVLERLREVLPETTILHDALQGGDPVCGS